MLGPPATAVEADDQCLVAVERLDEGQAGLARHREGGGQRVRQAEVGPGHTGRADPNRRAARVRIDQVAAPLVAARGGDRPGERDDLGQPARCGGIADTDPERAAGPRIAEAGDVTSRVHHRPADARIGERGERPLGRPPFHIAGRVHPAGHRPRVEPAARELPRGRAAPQDVGHLSRSLGQGDLPGPQSADRAIRLPGAEHLVGALEDGPGPDELPADLVDLGRGDIPRGVHVDGHDRAHHVLQVMNRTSEGHWKLRLCRADCSDWVNPALV
jgi:hypothetical protein